MKAVLCLALAAVALARIPSRKWEQEHFRRDGAQLKQTAFKRGSEYEFQYNGQVATGIPGSSRQHAATRVQALVSLVLKGEDKALLQIQQVRMGRLNQQLYNPRAMVPFMAFQEVELQQSAEKELKLPVMFTYQNGVVSDIVFDGQERPWSANIKKGILNMLQVNLGKQGQLREGQEEQLLSRLPQQETQGADFFATQEKTVEGQCETLYTVVSNPAPRGQQDVLNVTRTVQFENCKQRPEIKYNFRFQDPCESCEAMYSEDQKFLKSSSVAKFNISGNAQEFLIESALVESQYQVVPFNREGNLISTYVNQTLVLQRAGPIQSKIGQPKNPQESDSDLVYTMDWDKDMEEFLMKGQEEARLPVDIKDRVPILATILRALVAEMRDCVSEQAPLEYARLVKVLRFSSKDQLQQIFQHFAHQQPQGFSQEEHLKIKDILTDALADAATKDAISFLLRQIREEKISPLRAAVTIKQLNNIRTPSKEIVQEFQQFLESPVVKRNFVLKQAAYLTLGSIVQGLCMPSEERLAILPRPSSDKLPRRLGPNNHLCPQQLQDQLLEKLFGMVKAEQENEDEQLEEAVLALKTVSNMGIPKAIVELEKIIKSQEEEYPELIRIEAMMALRQLREAMPQKIQQILMPIYMSRQESNEIRMVAVHQILETMPSRPILEQVARQLFQERSQQVGSFVYTYMSTLSNSTNPCEQTLAKDLKLALRHGRQVPRAFAPHLSKFIHQSAYSQKFRLGGDVAFTSVISNRTMIPRYMGFNVHATALGFWSKYLVSVGISQQNIESILSRALRRTDLDDISLDDILARSPRAQQGAVKELKKLWKQLKTQARHMPQGAQGLINLQLKDQEFFMAPITQKTLNKLPSLQQIRRQLQQGQHFNIHKAAQLHEVMYKIPTTIGMPLVASVQIPTVAKLTGQVRMETKNPFKLQINNLKPAMAASVITKVNIWNPVAASGLKVLVNTKVCAPITGKAVLDIKGRQPSLRLSLEPVEKPVEWVKIETRPMTFTRQYRFPLTAYPKAQYKTIVGEQWNRVNQVRDFPIVHKAEKMIQKVLGMQVRVDGQWHHTPMNAPAYLPVCPFSGPNFVSIKSQESDEQPKEIVLKLSAQMEPRQSLRSQDVEMDFEDFQQEQYQTEKAIQALIKTELYTKGQNQERKAQMETRVSFAPNLRILKTEMTGEIQPIPQVLSRKVQLCTKAQIQYPQAAARFSQLRGKTVTAKVEATWGQDECKESNKVEMKLAARHSEQQEQQWEQEPELKWYADEQEQEPARFSPVNLQQPLHQQQQLLKYFLQAHWQNVSPVVKNATNGLFRALKTYYYWNTNQVNFDLENPRGQLQAEMTIDAKTKQFFNMTVKTPVENVTFTDAELPMTFLAPISVRKAQQEIEEPMDLIENAISGALQTCQINARRVKTFDGAKIRAPLSTCWTVLAKDCDNQQSPAFAVLAKKTQKNSQQKAIKIITQKHTIVIEPENQEYDSLKVKVNGKWLSEEEFPQNQHVEIQKQWEGQQVQVNLRRAGVRVQFDGYAAKIQVTPIVASAQCGICGHQNYDSQDEFRSPQNERLQDAREWIQSYTVKEGKCQFPQELSQIADSQEDMEFQPQWEQEARYEQEQTEEQEDEWDQLQPVQRILVDEEGRKLCFSAQKVPVCPRDSFPAQYEEEEQEVQFRCISRGHPEAHRFARIARQQSHIPQDMEEELQQHQPQYSQQIPIPTLCQRN